MSLFEAVASEGGLLPSDLLSRVAVTDTDLEGVGPESYGLVPGERLNDHITRSWNRLVAVWSAFSTQLDGLSESDNTATRLTRERWLRPLLDELGFVGLKQISSQEIDGKSYAISHRWGANVAVHQMGARVRVDRLNPGVPGAATTSPHGLVQEFLNRSDSHLWALLTNGLVLRVLRDNASLTRQAYLEFDLEAMFDGELYSDFVILWLACHRTRFEGDPQEKCILEQWSQEAAATGTRALDRLRDGVETAITSLGEGFLAHRSNADLRTRLTTGDLTTEEYQRQLLRVVYRLLFLLVAEARDLLHAAGTNEVARARYRDFYSVSRIAAVARVRRGTSHDDLWDGLRVTMTALHHDGAPVIGLSPLGSLLWSPEAIDGLADARLDNRHMLDAVRALTLVRATESKSARSVDYRNLGAEELGSVYESLLELHAEVDVQARTFELGTAAGHERKTTGSYYTPSSLINELLDSALDPVLDEAARSPDPEAAILGLSVLDPACGSGHFLIAAAHRIARRLASVRSGGIEPAPDQVRTAVRDVIGRCVHGIDLNPMAVELCKVSLWLEAIEPGRPLSFLDHRIRLGNALIGTTPSLLAAGVPDAAFKPLEGDDKTWVTSLRKRNKAEREGQHGLDFDAGGANDSAGTFAASLAEIDALADDTVEAVEAKQRLHRKLGSSPEAARARMSADAWCAAFVALKRPNEQVITSAVVRRLAEDPAAVSDEVVNTVRRLAREHNFVHPHLEFADVFDPTAPGAVENDGAGWFGGFDVVLGNPPWERVKLQEKEWFSERDPDIASAPNAAARKRMIAGLEESDPGLFSAFVAARRESEGVSHFLRQSGRFPLCGRGDVNTYTVFAELMRVAVGASGRVGVIVPSGIATDDTTKFFFQDLVECRSLVSLFDFENRKAIFPGVHRSYKFCLLTLSGVGRPVVEAEFVFFALDTADLNDVERRFTLSPEDFVLLNPNTRTCPIFRSRRDAEITKGIYRRVPVLVDENDPNGDPWGLYYLRLIDYSDHRDQLVPAEDSPALLPASSGDMIPVREAKLFHQFDSRYAIYSGSSVELMSDARKGNASLRSPGRFYVEPQFFRQLIGKYEPLPPFFLAYRDVARSTDERTIIAAAIPVTPASRKAPVLGFCDADSGLLLLGGMNSLIFDYVARQKVGGISVAYGVVKQLPFFHPSDFDQPTGFNSACDLGSWVRQRVLELVVNSWDLVDALQQAAPYRWNPGRRDIIRAELDAAFFHLFGISREEVVYIMDEFPIVRRKDEAKHGEYRTKRMILEIYDRMAEAVASGQPCKTTLDPPPGHPSLCHDPNTRPDWADLYLSPVGRSGGH